MSRIDGVPVYAQRDEQIPAELYNLWRRFKLHFKLPIEIPITEMHGLALFINDNEWICVDQNQNDVPILAWIDFADQHRDALHTPVTCHLNYYHYAASRLRVKVLEYFHDEIAHRLRPASEQNVDDGE